MSFGLEDKQVRHGGPAVFVLEILEFLTVQPISVSLSRFQSDFEHAGFSVGVVVGFTDGLRSRVLPGCRPTPRAIGHFLAESDFDFKLPRSDFLGSRFGHGFDHHRRHRVNSWIWGRNAGEGTKAAKRQNSQKDLFHFNLLKVRAEKGRLPGY